MPKLFGKPIKFNIKVGQPKMRRIQGIPINMMQTKDKIILRAKLFGFKKDDIKLKVTSTTISISAEKKREKIEKDEGYYREEASAGSFQRMMTLPAEIKPDKVKAKFINGVLDVMMPKKKSLIKKKEKTVKIE